MTNNKLSALFMTALMVLSVFAGVGTVSAVNADPAPQATDLTVGQDTATHEITYSTTIEADGEETVTVDASAITDDGADVLGVGASFDEDDGNLSVSDKSIDDGTIEVTVENTEDAETTGNVTLTLVHDTSDLGPSDAGTVQFTLDQDDLASTLDVNVDLVPNEVTDGGLAFQGEVIHVPVSDLNTDNLVLRQVEDASEEETSFLSEVNSENGFIEIDTENYEGDLIIMDGTGFDNGTTFEVAVQDLTANWSEDSVTQNDEEDLELESGRSDYIVEVSADSLDVDDLEEIFQGADEFIASNEEDDSVYLDGDTDSEITANFSDDIDAGDYEFDVEVTDTTASDSASIEVTEEDTDITFGQSVYTEEVGDVVEMSVEMDDTDEAYVFVGGEEVNYLEAVHLVDDDEDGMVNFTYNTFLAGFGEGASTDAFEVEGDDELGDDEVTRITNDDIPNELDSRLETGEYDLRVSNSLDYNDDDDEVEDEQDVATLDLSERNTSGIATWTAPRGDAGGFDDVEEMLTEVNQSSTLAIGDRLVVQVNASGVSGIVDDGDIDSIQSNGINLSIEESDAGANVEGAEVTLTDDNAEIYENQSVADDQFFVVVDTRDTDFFEDDESYEAIFTVGDEDAENSPIDYVDDEEEESVSTEFSAEDPDAELDLNDDDFYEVAVSENAQVSFDTNLAGGSEVSVRLRSSGDSAFLLSDTVETTADGGVNVTFDTSDREVGQEFEVTVRGAGEELASEDGVFVESLDNETDTNMTETEMTETEMTETEMTDTGTEAPGTDTEAPGTDTEAPGTDTGTEPGTETGTPGFGVVVAVTALLAAALLAVRRD